MDRYREENGSVYEFSKEHNAYIYIGKLNGDTLQEFIEVYERTEYHPYCECDC